MALNISVRNRFGLFQQCATERTKLQTWSAWWSFLAWFRGAVLKSVLGASPLATTFVYVTGHFFQVTFLWLHLSLLRWSRQPLVVGADTCNAQEGLLKSTAVATRDLPMQASAKLSSYSLLFARTVTLSRFTISQSHTCVVIHYLSIFLS